MPVIGARGRVGKSSREQAKSREQRAEQAKNQAEVKQAVNEVQQIADTFKQSEQTANSYTVKFKPVTFKPVVYVQNHIPKETNYGSGECSTSVYVAVFAYFAMVVLIDILWNKIKGRKKNNNTDQNGKSGCEYNSETIKSGKKETLTSNIMTIIAASIMILCTLVVIGEILLKL